jgi:hypothetical protein
VFLDGVYARAADGGLVFRSLPRLSTSDVADVVRIARARILRYLERRGVVQAVSPIESAGGTSAPCQLQAVTMLQRRGPLFEVRALVRNITEELLVLEVPGRCPEGAAQFRGLGEHYDYYGACVRGACARSRPPLRYAIDPGKSVEVTSIQVNPVATACTPALAAGSYTLGFDLKTSLRFCQGSRTTLEVRAGSKAVAATSGSATQQAAPKQSTRRLGPARSFRQRREALAECRASVRAFEFRTSSRARR